MKLYETAAFDGEGEGPWQLQATLIDLCYSLLKVQINIVCPRDSNNYGILSKQSTRGLVNDLSEYAVIKQLDDLCKDQFAYMQNLRLATCLKHVQSMEAEMDKRVRAEVARQFDQLAPYIMQELVRSLNEALRHQDANRRPPPPPNIADGQGSNDDGRSRTPEQPNDQAQGHNEHASTSRDSQPKSHKDNPTSQ